VPYGKGSHWSGIYTLTYRAASPGQTLRVEWTQARGIASSAWLRRVSASREQRWRRSDETGRRPSAPRANSEVHAPRPRCRGRAVPPSYFSATPCTRTAADVDRLLAWFTVHCTVSVCPAEQRDSQACSNPPSSW